MKWHPDSRDKAKTSLWEPTKQTEEYWRRQIQREVSDWHYEHMEDKTERVPDSEDPALGDWKFVIPPAIEDGTSDTFTAPDGKGEWLTQHSTDPSNLPASVAWAHPGRFQDAPTYDNDVDDCNEDAWAAEIVKERAIRVHTCFGLVCYLQPVQEWRKRNVRTDLQRYWDYFDFSATWWHPFSPVFHLFPPVRMSPLYAFFSVNTLGIEQFKLSKEPTPVGEWKMGHKCDGAPCTICTDYVSRLDRFSVESFSHPRPAWRPFISKDPYATHGGKRQQHIQTPWHSEPVPMPWNNPVPTNVAAWADLFEGEQPDHLSTYLKRLLFMNDYIVTDPFRDSPVLPYAMKDADGNVVEVGQRTRRLRLTASCGYRYAKSIERMDHRIVQKIVTEEESTWERDDDGRLVCVIEEQDSDFQMDTWTVGEEEIPIRGARFDLTHWQNKRNYGVKYRLKIGLRWEIRRRDRRWIFRPEKVPGYTLHCSHQSIMAITGCSRATAFRWIEKFMAEPPPDYWRGLVGPTKAERYK